MPRFRSAAVLLLLALLGPAAPALFAQADPFEGLQVGQRVEVILKNNTIFRGEVHWIASDRIKLDVTYDTTELQGYLTFHKTEVRSASVVKELTEKDKQRILREKNAKIHKYQDELAARAKREQGGEMEKGADAEAGKGPNEGETPKDPKQAAEEKARQAQKDLLAKFPPDDWGKERYEQIQATAEQSRTELEKEFMAGFDRWQAAQEADNKDARKALLEKFPPEKGWGPDKLEELRMKELSSLHTGRPTHIGGERVSNGRTRPTLTDEENEFVDHFDQWKLALQEDTEAKKAAAAAKEGTPEETPKTPEETPKAPEETPKAPAGEHPGGTEGNK